MKNCATISILLFSIALTCLQTAGAVEVMKCESETGEVTFEKFCPPGSKQLESKTYRGNRPPGNQANINEKEVVLYEVPGCDLCTQIRDFLTSENVTFTGKNVKDDVNLQEELRKKADGKVRVPILVIGDDVLTGFDTDKISEALAKNGFLEQK